MEVSWDNVQPAENERFTRRQSRIGPAWAYDPERNHKQNLLSDLLI